MRLVSLAAPRRIGRIWLACVTLVLAAAAAASDTVTYNPEQVVEKEELISAILRLALSYTDRELKVVPFSERLPGSRAEQYVAEGKLDVWWAGASQDREAKMRAVYIPVLKGLVGHRLFLIHRDAQHKFDHVYALADLQTLTAGQGRTWGDAMVLRAADMPMETATKTVNLFYMLDGGRFDYFPRSAHEPWVEVEKYAQLDIVVEKKLVLIYPQPMYFYVNRDNLELHEKIRQGFEMAIADGAFDQLFFNHPMIKDILGTADLKNRRAIRIANPLLTPQAPIERPELWLDINRL